MQKLDQPLIDQPRHRLRAVDGAEFAPGIVDMEAHRRFGNADLADEPTGNLDPATSELVFSALLDLIRNEGAACLIATHNHDLARRADRVVTLRTGWFSRWNFSASSAR